MMPLIHAAMLRLSSSLAVSIVVKATVSTALGLIAAWLARRNRAAVRHALLAAAFGVLLLLPIASIMAPAVRIAVPEAVREPNFPSVAGFTGAFVPAAPAVLRAASEASPPAAISPSALLLAGWIAGMSLCLLPVAIGLWQVRALRRAALPWGQGQLVVDGLAAAAGVGRRVEALLHEALPGPMTCGVMHPAILLPPDAQTWDAEDLTRAIVHELEHVRRRDRVSQCLARALCAVYWFHPLVWMAWRRLALEAERSCDDAVLGRSEATAYADQLVGLARRLSTAERLPTLAMANRADLATRVGAVLDGRQRRGRAGAAAVALACLAAGMLVIAISPLKVVAAPQSAADVQVIPARFRSATNLVILDVTVSDANGNAVEGLGAKDFAVTEDGRPQAVSVCEFQKLASPQDSLSSYYTLGYYAHNENADGSYRTIKVTGKADNMVKMDYRAGYYARKIIPNSEPGNPIAIPDIRPPALISKVEPAYSDEARKAKYQGTVVLTVEIDPSGDPASIKVNRSLGLGLDEKAVEAVTKWRFRPAMQNARPIPVQVQVEVSFRLW